MLRLRDTVTLISGSYGRPVFSRQLLRSHSDESSFFDLSSVAVELLARLSLLRSTDERMRSRGSMSSLVDDTRLMVQAANGGIEMIIPPDSNP